MKTDKKDRLFTRPNPFDQQKAKPKFEILNRKIKGQKGTPGISKSKALETRKKNLLSRLKASNRNSKFIDKRIGARDSTLDEDELMLKRFTAERSLQQREEISLANELATKYSLTHKGRSLDEYGSEFSDYSGPEEDDESQRGTIDKETVRHTHFGGFSDSTALAPDAVRKTKAEVMREVIAKSKAYKMERQKMKEENEELREQLNQDFDDLRGLLFTDQVASEEKEEAPLGDYDSLVRELAFDKRGKPSDRLKTEAEVALMERERLEQLEQERCSRMQAVFADESVSEEDEEAEAEENEEAEAETEEEAEEETETEAEADEDSCDSQLDLEADSEKESENQSLSCIEKNSGLIVSSSKVPNSIPFIIPIPSTYKELTSMCHRPLGEVLAIVQRILTFHSPLAHPQTKPQMAIFHPILLKFLFERFSKWENTQNLNAFVNLVIANCKFFPMETTLFLKSQVFKVASVKPLCCSHALLFVCKFVFSLLSCSDFYNPVVTPTYILLAMLFERAAKGKEDSKEELPQLLFLADLFLQSQQQHSKRIMPELFGFLARVSKFKLFREGESISFSSLIYGSQANEKTECSSPVKFNTFEAYHNVLERLCLTYRENIAFLEIVEPFAGEAVFQEAIAKAMTHRNAHPLQLHKEKAKEIPTLEPDFVVDSREAKAKLTLEQREELESKKLRYQLKQEKKSLIKEIRKDSAFIASYKHKKLIEADKAYRQKMNSIIGQVANEASASKNPTNPPGKKQKMSKF